MFTHELSVHGLRKPSGVLAHGSGDAPRSGTSFFCVAFAVLTLSCDSSEPGESIPQTENRAPSLQEEAAAVCPVLPRGEESLCVNQQLMRTRREEAGLPVCRSAGLPVCRSAGLPVCRSAGLLVAGRGAGL